MDSQQPDVSVVIRNRNEGTFLREVLYALSVQAGVSWELIVVDNESTDESVKVAREHGAIVVSLARERFSYGRALNHGMAVARGKVCVILSAHSLPLGHTFLKACAAPFQDPQVAAVRCVYAGKGSDATRWIAPEVLDASSSVDEIVSKGPLANGCAIRRTVWKAIPFDENVIAAEDKLWALRAVRAGYTILSPCDAFYLYLKPLSPAELLRKNDLELRAILSATGERLGGARAKSSTTLLQALWAISTEAPRAAAGIVHREATRFKLRLAFPDSAERESPLRMPANGPAKSSTLGDREGGEPEPVVKNR